MINKEHAISYIKVRCEDDENFRKNIEALDEYDFSPYLTQGRRIESAIEAIEKVYDNKCFDKYGFFLFDNLSPDEIQCYFISRYNIYFQEYIDWVIRHENGSFETIRRYK